MFEKYRSEQMALISHLNKESQSRLEKFVVIHEVLEKYNIKPHQLRDTLDSALKQGLHPQQTTEQQPQPSASLSQSFNSQGQINLNTNNNMINLNFNLNVASPPTPIHN